jgi:hypothetical protein
VLHFWRDQPHGPSLAEPEWDDIDNRFPAETARLETHLRRVEAAASTTSWQLSQATHVNPVPPDNLYWWGVRGVGAFYLYDGTDLAIVLVGVETNPPSWIDLRDMARNRV